MRLGRAGPLCPLKEGAASVMQVRDPVQRRPPEGSRLPLLPTAVGCGCFTLLSVVPEKHFLSKKVKEQNFFKKKKVLA